MPARARATWVDGTHPLRAGTIPFSRVAELLPVLPVTLGLRTSTVAAVAFIGMEYVKTANGTSASRNPQLRCAERRLIGFTLAFLGHGSNPFRMCSALEVPDHLAA